MHPRTVALACCIILLHAVAGGGGERERVPGPRREVIDVAHQQPLPFLGSGGVAVQAPALEPTAPLPALRARAASGSARPPLRCRSAGNGPELATSPLYLQAGRDACRLGTPPPRTLPGLA